MAYPFAQAPTTAEYVARLVRDHGCVLRNLDDEADYQIVGPRGPVQIKYLSRTVDGREFLSEPLPEDMDERLSPDSTRRLIVQLKLPREVWPWAGDPYNIPDDDD